MSNQSLKVQPGPMPNYSDTQREYVRSILRMRSRTFDEQVVWIEYLLLKGMEKGYYVGGEDAVGMIYLLAGDLQSGSDQQFMIDLLMDTYRNACWKEKN